MDRLSELPDAILCHILSFLPTKTSVATSILSRRWRFVWAYVPNLDFHIDCENQHIIDKVLSQHKLPSLKSLNIEIRYHHHCDEFPVETWIIAAIDRNVQHLKLDVGYDKFLPCRLFTCESLVDLSLDGCGKIPTLHSAWLPCLKKLYLQNVEFEDDESLPCLLSGSPVLEYFDFLIQPLIHDEFRMNSCYISSPTVKSLRLESILGGLGPRQQGHKLVINTPSLEYLDLLDNLSGPIEFGDLSCLVAADIGHEPDGTEEDEVLCCVSLFKFVDSLSNVRSLDLDLSGYAKIVDSLLSAWTPSFNNLTKLKLIAHSCFLPKFLENANNLEILVFRKQTANWIPECDLEEPAKCWKEPQQVPKCLLSRLTTIKILDTVMVEDGLEIVRYLLRNAQVLKRMDVRYPRATWFGSEEINDLLQKISLFERISKACELVVTQR